MTENRDSLREIMTWSGLVTPIVAMVFIFSAVYVNRAWFSWQNDALSGLGSPGATDLWIYNLGLALTATLGVIFALRIFDYLENRVSKAGSIVFMVGIFCLGLVGVFHGGHPQHQLATNLFFGLSTMGTFIVGIGESIEREPLGYLWIVLVVIGAVLAYLTTQWFSGAAIPEMVGAVAYSIFSVVYFARIKKYI